MNATATINGIAYDGPGRAAANVTSATLSLTLDGVDTYSWSEQGCGPVPTWREWQTVTLSVDGTLRFSGRIRKVERARGPVGWQFAYTAAGLKGLADSVPVRSRDGSGEACFNMPPAVNDPSYVASLIGLTVGQIVAKVLTVPETAQALNALGIGGYSGLPATPALHPTTTADLAALDIVPRQGVTLSGLGVFNQLQSLIQQWHRRFLLYVRPDGVIRLFDVTGLGSIATRAISVPGDDGGGDPVEWPSYDRDIDGCYTQVQIVGRDIQAVTLSTKDGTLTPVQGTGAAWTTVQEAAWRYSDFLAPRDASDDGTLSGVTLTGATVTSSDNTRNWPANFWQGRGGRIFLYKDAGGATFGESRAITNSAALTAGGSATVGWDASIPLQATDYTRYRIEGLSSPQSLVGRAFLVRDASTGQTGLNSYVGAHLVTAFPAPVAWNTSVSSTLTSTPVGAVFWSIDGSAVGFNSITVPIEVDPEQGRIVAAYPIVQATASRAQLDRGYPTTFAAGKPTEFRAVVAYSRGGLAAQAPASGYGGVGYSALGISRTLFVMAGRWTWIGDRPDMLKWANELYLSVRDPVDSGSVVWHGNPSWDFLTLGYAITLGLSNAAPSPWDGLSLPVRSVTLTWPESGPDVTTTRLEFSNRCQPYQGDSMFLHPNYGGGLDDFGGYDPGYGYGYGDPFGPAGFGPFDDGGSPLGPVPIGPDLGGDDLSGLAAISADNGAARRWKERADRENAKPRTEPIPGEDPFAMTPEPIVPPPPVPAERRDRPQLAEDDTLPLSERRRRNGLGG